ncbi:MAG: hypothetical protein Q7V53_06680, partial [Caldisericota bacterium]|nr:hypothetical protein [Caldisericota bacterium]
KATAAFASGFHKHQHLRSLNLSLAPTTAAYESLRPFFGSTSLTSLELEEHSDAVGPDEDCDSAAIGVVRHAKALRQLSIEIDYRNTQKHQALAEALRAMPNLKALSGWRLAEKDPKVLRGLDDLLAASAVRTYKRLGVATTEALLRRNAIESLWLASDYSLDERLKSFAAALKATESLHTLILFGGGLNSPLDPKKAKLLLQVLGANTSLKALTLSLPMKVSVAKDVVRSLGKRGRIKTVNLAMPTTTDEQRQIVAAAKGTTQVSFVARLAEDWE